MSLIVPAGWLAEIDRRTAKARSCAPGDGAARSREAWIREAIASKLAGGKGRTA